MTIPTSLLYAIGRAVEKAGGDADDVDDLVKVWERLHADAGGKLDRLRYENEQRQRQQQGEPQ
jgi:hypothetical protein